MKVKTNIEIYNKSNWRRNNKTKIIKLKIKIIIKKVIKILIIITILVIILVICQKILLCRLSIVRIKKISKILNFKKINKIKIKMTILIN